MPADPVLEALSGDVMEAAGWRSARAKGMSFHSHFNLLLTLCCASFSEHFRFTIEQAGLG